MEESDERWPICEGCGERHPTSEQIAEAIADGTAADNATQRVYVLSELEAFTLGWAAGELDGLLRTATGGNKLADRLRQAEEAIGRQLGKDGATL